MKRLFSDMDWLKGLILFCIIASIALGIWNWMLAKQLDSVRTAWNRTQKDYSEIVQKTKQIQSLYEALDQQSDEDIDHSIYFQKQLTEFAKIPSKAYTFGDVNPRETKIAGKRRGQQTTVVERVVPIKFSTSKNDRLYVTREQVFVACYNAEKNSKRWTLQDLSMRAKEVAEGYGPAKGYPEELSDEWQIQDMKFVSREPVGKKK
ncbi:MAG: hypothetical protein H6832_13545 [Planctomycetes bacterium]|nr:hypothetical protein [Planctomycetota bacterium]MCB9919421.1 hypothetical protein [Planctomycetota bacterium]